MQWQNTISILYFVFCIFATKKEGRLPSLFRKPLRFTYILVTALEFESLYRHHMF